MLPLLIPPTLGARSTPPRDTRIHPARHTRPAIRDISQKPRFPHLPDPR